MISHKPYKSSILNVARAHDRILKVARKRHEAGAEQIFVFVPTLIHGH